MPEESDMKMMQANVFRGVNHFGVEDLPRPHAGPGETVIRTTICGTDFHIVRGEYPVKAGRPQELPAVGLSVEVDYD
jgi:threonine dehydrogenase-like Zn-dependent dehydrogenase